MKATAQSLCSVLKYSPFHHLISMACVSNCSPLLCFGIQAPSWRPWKDQVYAPCNYASQVREQKLLSSPGVMIRSLVLGLTRCFLKMTNRPPKFSQAFDRVHPPVRLSGLYGLVASPGSPARLQSGAGEGKGGGSVSPLMEQCYDPLERENL